MATRYIRKYGGVIGGAIGGTIGTLIAPGVGTSIGASLGSGIGSSIDDTIEADKAEKNAIAQERQQHRLISSLQQIEMDNAITPTPTFRDGGDITRYNGNSHENGGIQLGATTEVEGGETRGIDDTKDYIFSDTLKPNGSKKTYAELSKDIDNKYIRKNDRFSMASKNRELQNL